MRKNVGNRRRVGALAVLAGTGLALSAGVAVPNTNSGSGQAVTPLSVGESDQYQDSAIGPDGSVYHVGYVDSAAVVDRVVALTKTKADGTLDTSFGIGGIVTKNFRSGPFQAGPVGNAPTGTSESGRAVVVQEDGKIIVVAHAETPADSGKDNLSDNDIYVSRFNPDGTLDTAYGTNGVLRIDLSDGIRATGIRADQAYGAAIRPDGRLVIFASKGTDSGDPTRAFSDLAIISVTTAGALDATYGDAGVAVGGAPDIDENPRHGLVEADGKLIIAGYGGNPQRPILFRTLADGTPDPTFGTNGSANVPLPPSTGRAEAYAMVPQGDKYVIAAYGARAESSGNTDAILYRINQNGTWDTTFGPAAQGGLVSFDGGVGNGADRFRNVAGLPDGRFVAVGATATQAAPEITSGLIAVFKADGTFDTSVGDNGIIKVDFGGNGDHLWGLAVNGLKVTASGLLGGGAVPKRNDAALAWLDLTPKADPPAPPAPPAEQPPAPKPAAPKARTAGKVAVSCQRIGAKKTIVRCTVTQANVGKGRARVIVARNGYKTLSQFAPVSAKGKSIVTFRAVRRPGSYTVALRLPTPHGNIQAVSRKVTVR